MSLISENAIIRGDVRIGSGVIVEPYAIINGPCEIGDDCNIGAHAVIGGPPQHTGSYPHPIHGKYSPMGVQIGKGVCIREFSTIHQGLVITTVVGDNSLVMTSSHIAHDCMLGAGVTAGSYLALGGFSFIDDEVTFGQGCVTHPWTCVGRGSMIGLNSSVLTDVKPYDKVAGAPARVIGKNERKAYSDDIVMDPHIWDEFAALTGRRDHLKTEWYNNQR